MVLCHICIYDVYAVCEASFILWNQNDRVPHLGREVCHVSAGRIDACRVLAPLAHAVALYCSLL